MLFPRTYREEVSAYINNPLTFGWSGMMPVLWFAVREGWVPQWCKAVWTVILLEIMGVVGAFLFFNPLYCIITGATLIALTDISLIVASWGRSKLIFLSSVLMLFVALGVVLLGFFIETRIQML